MIREIRFGRTIAIFTLFLVVAGAAHAQYRVTNLVSSQAGGGKFQDNQLVNAWGLAFAPTGPIWVGDNGTGVSTIYTGAGVKQGLVVTIPSASGVGRGKPTGIVFNNSSDFVVTQGTSSGPAIFLFDTEDGTISGWSPSVNSTTAIIVANSPGSDYTGLATGVSNGKKFLYAADNHNNRVDIYDSSFTLVGSFTDPNLPAGSNPYNVQNIKGKLFVTFTNSAGTGVVDIFDTQGNLLRTLVSGAPLAFPWGLALAPDKFGVASNAILVGNLVDGKINAFDFHTGNLIGPLSDQSGSPIVISDLWGIAFGKGSVMNGKQNQLFFTAGPLGYRGGTLGVIDAKQ